MTWGLRTTLAVGLLVLGAGDLAAIDTILLPGYLGAGSQSAPNPVAVPTATVPVAAIEPVDTAPSADGDGDLKIVPAAQPEPAAQAALAGEPKAQAVDGDEAPTWPRLLFEMNATRLADESRETLDRLAGYLKQHPALEVVLEGHTDDLGGPDVNHPLSRMRANRARSWLVAQGIDTARIAVHNFGSSKPVAPGRTAEARAQNRRVEITVRERID
jgi:outer membrane protein OmpA-like peptidoglycan-associated protein